MNFAGIRPESVPVVICGGHAGWARPWRPERYARRLEHYGYGILNHCDYPIHTSKLERINNKIKVIKRRAYGFHGLGYFALKIQQAFDPENRLSFGR